MAATQFYLPDDCWESVFKFLDNGIKDNNTNNNNNNNRNNSQHHHLKSVSLVSKQFLSITNTLRFSLNVHNPTCAFLHRLFKRFTNLTSLNLTKFRGDLDALLSQISCFRLNLTSLDISNQTTIPANGLRAFSLKITTLTSLTCLDVRFVKSSDLFLIAECFPLLEELNLNNPRKDFILDQTIETLSLALFKLRKVNLSGRYFINNQVLHHFFKNCKHLKEVQIVCSFNITEEGIASSLRERPTLTSLSLTSIYFDARPTSNFIDSLVSLKGLTRIDWFRLRISDELLYSIAREGLPLTRLVLRLCTGYSYDGISYLLSKCQSIRHLNLQNAYFLKDEHVVELSLFLGDLVSINLSDCNMLTISALFALVRKCPSLNEITMGRSSMYSPLSNEEINHQFKSLNLKKVENSNSLMDCVVNHQLKSLSLAFYLWLMDEDINMFAPIFSNLQLLDLSHCGNISEASIGQVLSRCHKIRHLNLSLCKGVKLHGLNFEFLKLEVLDLSCTSIDDETLYMILKSCCEGLLQLNLEKCYQITKKGVMHVVKYCTQLKEINLSGCRNVPSNVVASMVFLRPSLRMIFTPSRSNFSDIEKKHFLHRRGCHVY